MRGIMTVVFGMMFAFVAAGMFAGQVAAQEEANPLR